MSRFVCTLPTTLYNQWNIMNFMVQGHQRSQEMVLLGPHVHHSGRIPLHRLCAPSKLSVHGFEINLPLPILPVNYSGLHTQSVSLFFVGLLEDALHAKCAVRQLDWPHQTSLEIYQCKMEANWEPKNVASIVL